MAKYLDSIFDGIYPTYTPFFEKETRMFHTYPPHFYGVFDDNRNKFTLQKPKPLSEEQLKFMFENVPRMLVKTKVKELNVRVSFVQETIKTINIKNKNYDLIDKNQTKRNLIQKNKIIEALNNANDFEFYYDKLATYDYLPEPDDVFLKRIKEGGNYLFEETKKKYLKKLKTEKRKVLFEKKIVPKKRKKREIVEDENNEYYDAFDDLIIK